MIDFDEGLKPSKDNLATQIKKHRDFVYIFKNKEKEVDKLIFDLQEIYENRAFSNKYAEGQIKRLRNISESFENTFLIGSSAITEVKKIGDLGLNWDSLENLVKDYHCNSIHTVFKDYLNTFYNSWRSKIKVDGTIEVTYIQPLEEHLKAAENFKNFNPAFMGEKVSEFVENITPYVNELNKNVEILNLLNNIASDIETKINHPEFKENLEKLRDNLVHNLDILRNARIIYSKAIGEDFENEFSKFLEETNVRILTDAKIVEISKNSSKNGKNIIGELLYSSKSQEEESIILKRAIDLINDGRFSESKTELEGILKLNDKSSKAHFYIGLHHLRDITNLNTDQKNVKKWYDKTLEKAINEIEKAKEYSLAETSLHQSKTYALLAYSRLLSGKEDNNLLDLINQSIKLSDNSLSRFVKSKVVAALYLDREYVDYYKRILANLNKIVDEDVNNTELKDLIKPEDLFYEKAKLIMQKNNLKYISRQDILKRKENIVPNIKNLLIRALDINKNHIPSHTIMSKVLLWEGEEHKEVWKKDYAFPARRSRWKIGWEKTKSLDYKREIKKPYKKESEKHKKIAFELSQNELEKHEDNPIMIKFLLDRGPYEPAYENYIPVASKRKGEKIEKILEEMQIKGNFKRIRV